LHLEGIKMNEQEQESLLDDTIQQVLTCGKTEITLNLSGFCSLVLNKILSRYKERLHFTIVKSDDDQVKLSIKKVRKLNK
jgi:hypothetical protein